MAEIPIEARSGREVTHIQGLVSPADGVALVDRPRGESNPGTLTQVQLTPTGSLGFNPAFDVTPARLVTALITERGVVAANEESLKQLYGVGEGH